VITTENTDRREVRQRGRLYLQRRKQRHCKLTKTTVYCACACKRRWCCDAVVHA